MKNKLKTRKNKNRNKKYKNRNNKNRISMKSKKYKRKQRQVTRKKYIRGGTLSDTSRFNIQIKTNEITNKDNNVLQKHFLVVTDKIKNKEFLVNIGNADNVNLFLFERNVEENKDNVYLYHINYGHNVSSIQNIPFESIKNYIGNGEIYESIINNQLEIDEKIDLLSQIDYLRYISINIDNDLTEIVNDYVINKDEAIIELNKLNGKLIEKCPNLELKFDYLINQPGIVSVLHIDNSLTLCLYNQGNCISSIICMIKPDDDKFTFAISSQTNPSMQGRNFNKLLRAAIIIIANRVTVNGQNIQSVYSEAENPTSALLLLKYFNAESLDDDFNRILKKKTNDNRSLITHDFIKKYMEKYGDIELEIKLNPENIENAHGIFNLTVINCDGIERKWNERIITKEINYMSDEEE